jgi:hypothetical protein
VAVTGFLLLSARFHERGGGSRNALRAFCCYPDLGAAGFMIAEDLQQMSGKSSAKGRAFVVMRRFLLLSELGRSLVGALPRLHVAPLRFLLLSG